MHIIIFLINHLSDNHHFHTPTTHSITLATVIIHYQTTFSFPPLHCGNSTLIQRNLGSAQTGIPDQALRFCQEEGELATQGTTILPRIRPGQLNSSSTRSTSFKPDQTLRFCREEGEEAIPGTTILPRIGPG